MENLMATIPSYVQNVFATDAIAVGTYTPGQTFNPPATGEVDCLSVSTLDIEATEGTVTTLTSTTGTITTLGCTTGNIVTVNSTTGNITTVNATTGAITTVNATTGNITTVNATTANVATLGYTGSSTTESEYQTTLTSGMVLALRASPIQLIAAPGADKIIVVNSCMLSYNYVSAAYGVTNVTLGLVLGSVATIGGTVAGAGLLDQTASTLTTIPTPNNTGLLVRSTATNQPLLIKNVGSAEAITGDGTLKVVVRYSVISL